MKQKESVKVLSCVPRQAYNLSDKLDFLFSLGKEKADVVVLPQEYFGGDYIMPEKPSFSEDELVEDLSHFCRTFSCSLVVGVVECEEGRKYQRLWFLNEKGVLVGKLTKFALPRYEDPERGGYYGISACSDYKERLQVFELSGLKVSGFFCWEVFSNTIPVLLGLLRPQLVISAIKFGVGALPKYKQVGDKVFIDAFDPVDTGWRERLLVVKDFVGCPIVCATNSWDLPAWSDPICGERFEVSVQLPNIVVDVIQKTRKAVDEDSMLNKVKSHERRLLSSLYLEEYR